jgi:hypothetical protein
MASVLKVDTIKSLTGNEAMTISEGGVPLLKVPAFSVLTTTNATMTSATLTKVPYDTVTFDSHNWFDTVNNRYVPQVAGYYQFNFTMSVTGTTVTIFLGTIYKNGSSIGNMFISRDSTSTSQTVTVSQLLYLNGSTDYVEGYARIDGSSNLRFTTPNYMNGFLVGGA